MSRLTLLRVAGGFQVSRAMGNGDVVSDERDSASTPSLEPNRGLLETRASDRGWYLLNTSMAGVFAAGSVSCGPVMQAAALHDHKEQA